MGDSGQKFIRRNRAPRVHISYQDPYDAEKQIELPFVMGVMSDLSGNDPGVEKPEVADRNFLDVDMDNFDRRMAAIEPGAVFKRRQQARRRHGREDVREPALQEDGRFQPGCGGAAGSGHGQASGGA